MNKTRMMWPLFWCLKPEDQAKLMQFQHDNFGLHLSIPPLQNGTHVAPAWESPEKIDRLMRQRPRRPRRVV